MKVKTEENQLLNKQASLYNSFAKHWDNMSRNRPEGIVPALLKRRTTPRFRPVVIRQGAGPQQLYADEVLVWSLIFGRFGSLVKLKQRTSLAV